MSSVTFAPDGSAILAVSEDNVTRLWDIEGWKELQRFEGHAGGIVYHIQLASDGRTFLTASGDHTARLWDVATGEELQRFEGHAEEVFSAVFAPNGRTILTASKDHTAGLWDITTGRERHRLKGHTAPVHSAVFAPDGGTILTVSGDHTARLWNVASGEERQNFSAKIAAFTSDGRSILTAGRDGSAFLWDAATGIKLHPITGNNFAAVSSVTFASDGRTFLAGTLSSKTLLYDTETGRELKQFEGHAGAVRSAVFAPDGRTILTASTDRTARLWDIATRQKVQRFDHEGDVFSGVFALDGRTILTSSRDHSARLWDVATGGELQRFEGHTGAVRSAVFAPDGRTILTASKDGTTRLWHRDTGQEMARLVSFRDDTWVVSTPDGRFDTNNLEEIKGLHWIVSDDPLHALPLEIFMRDYFEPRLLPRVLAGEVLPVVPSVANLNRAQPRVEIKEVRVVDEPQGLVDVRVEVGNQSLLIQRDGQPVPMQSGAYDLRLFRNGQLVAQSPAPEDEEGDVGQSREQELARWRERHRITLDPATGVTTITFSGIRLPRKTGVKDIELSAYAFNVDRVKSATARITVPIPTALRPRPGRAYVVTIGVNAYEQDALSRLSYAARDAQTLGAELSARLRQVTDPDTGQPVFGETQVIPITLVSEFGTGEQAGQLVTNDATKARIQAVIETLAGRSVDAALLQGIANADQLQSARPEDFVLLAFSTHGDTDQRGQFYLMPSDLGAGRGRKDLLEHAISSEELSVWLRSLDAGELVMIVDACHSAASVEDKEFKPGPMGSRGLGQLAFDKGMRILAASQRDQYALETEKTQQGLLSYALVREGLTENKANYKPTDSYIQLSEWLSYGAERVPSLYKDYREGKLKAKAATPLDRPESPTLVSIQRPALFDFARGRDLPISTPIRP
ncbi:hypothetical protein YTPLAS18_33190 [Nitrospira sp.]|nr:hypothetical protein YTPLAS18_33190 [Nitrospira sp.]